VLSVQSVKISI